MTVETDKAKSGPFIVTGAIDVFPRDFLILDETHLRVIRVRDEIETDLTTGISHTGIGTPDGTVTVSSNIQAGDVIYLLRSVPSVQQTDYNSQGRVRTEQIERDLDVLTMQLQDVREAQSRALTLTLSSDVTGPEAMAAALAAPAYAAQAQEAANLVLGMSPLSHYTDRAAATVANVSPQASHIAVSGMIYARDEAGTALTSGDGAKWTPIPANITPLAYGTGDEANTAMQSHLANNRGIVRIPKADYQVNGVTYAVDHEAMIFKASSVPVNLFASARNNQIVCVMDTPNEPVLDVQYSRVPINVNVRAYGGQHASGVRANLNNYSTDGAGCTAFYGHAHTYPGANWSAALHGETRHAGGTSMCVSVEAASFTTTGSFYGAVISNTTNNPKVVHNLGGNPIAHPSATGILVHGTGGDVSNLHRGSWAYGIDIGPDAIRPGGTGLRLRAPSFRHIHVAAGAPASGADIFLEANSDQGLALRGTYTTAAVTVTAGQKIALDATGAIALRYNSGLNRIEFLNASDVKAFLDMSAAGSGGKIN